MTPEQARQALNRMHADFQVDREHPYGYGNHAQHKDFVDYSTRLHTIIANAEAEAKDAREAEALEDARAEVGDLTPEQCLIRAKELTLTPGYINCTMAPEERAKLAKEISTLYLVGCQQEPETSTPEEEEVDDDL
jgi:hypothetical protein